MSKNRRSGFDMASNSSRLQWGTVPHQDPTKSSAVANRNCRVPDTASGREAIRAAGLGCHQVSRFVRLLAAVAAAAAAMEAARGSIETAAAAAVCLAGEALLSRDGVARRLRESAQLSRTHAQQPCRGPWQVMVYREEGCAHYGDQESSMFRPSQTVPDRWVPQSWLLAARAQAVGAAG